METNTLPTLTMDDLEKAEPQSILMSGVTMDTSDMVNIWDSNLPIHWVLVRGVIPDFAIYMRGSWNECIGYDQDTIARVGDKMPKGYIRKVINCDDEVLDWYRV